MKTSKLNIYEIAQKAKVSIATISRAMNPETRGKVAVRTLEKIDRLVEKLGYTPSLAAKNLTQTSTKTIGVVFPYLPGIFYSNYYNHILASVSDYLYSTDYRFKLLLLKPEQPFWNNFDFKAGEGVDGLLITHWFKYFSDKSVLEKINVPSVVINDIDKSVHAQFVGSDQKAGGQIAAEHLFQLGHRRIGVIAGPDWSLDSKQRIQGFKSYLKIKGVVIQSNQVVKGDFLKEVAYNEVEKLIKKVPDLTAIFACNDQMAVGAIQRLKEMGKECPKDISVIGFDDEPVAVGFSPQLTTVHVPIFDIAKEAAALLLKYLSETNQKKRPKGCFFLPMKIIERQSTSHKRK